MGEGSGMGKEVGDGVSVGDGSGKEDGNMDTDVGDDDVDDIGEGGHWDCVCDCDETRLIPGCSSIAAALN